MKNKIFEEMKNRNSMWRVDTDKIDELLEQHLDTLDYLLDDSYDHGKCRLDLTNWLAYVNQDEIKGIFAFMYDFCKSVEWLDYKDKHSKVVLEKEFINQITDSLDDMINYADDGMVSRYDPDFKEFYEKVDKANEILTKLGEL